MSNTVHTANNIVHTKQLLVDSTVNIILLKNVFTDIVRKIPADLVSGTRIKMMEITNKSNREFGGEVAKDANITPEIQAYENIARTLQSIFKPLAKAYTDDQNIRLNCTYFTPRRHTTHSDYGTSVSLLEACAIFQNEEISIKTGNNKIYKTITTDPGDLVILKGNQANNENPNYKTNRESNQNDPHSIGLSIYAIRL